MDSEGSEKDLQVVEVLKEANPVQAVSSDSDGMDEEFS